MIDAWLSLPLPALILILVAFYSASALVLIWLSFGALAGPWVRTFRGVVAPFAGAIVIIFSILVGFLANDVWDRNRRAAATVRGEAASLISLHALAATLGKPQFAIDRAIRAYAAAVIGKEWPRMENGEASPEAEAAQDELLQTVAQSETALGNAALSGLLLDTALKVRAARGDRLALSSDFSENPKWASVLLMAVMAQISVAAVHLDGMRAQIAAMVIITASIVLVIGLIATHEGPFQPPLGISPAPIAKLLAIVPKCESLRIVDTGADFESPAFGMSIPSHNPIADFGIGLRRYGWPDIPLSTLGVRFRRGRGMPLQGADRFL